MIQDNSKKHDKDYLKFLGYKNDIIQFIDAKYNFTNDPYTQDGQKHL